MIRTPFCDLVDVEYPIVHASFGPWSSVELAAAVSRAGALGSYGTAQRPYDVVRADMARLREEAEERPFAVNHVLRPLSREMYELTLEFEPPVISFALGLSSELIERAHEAGAHVLQQIHTVEQARRAAEAGADAIIAQGSEAAGFGGTVASIVLWPQVIEAVAPLPVLAAGGIADGRGLAAAFLLGAQGANIGTRFLASEEADVSEDWKAAVLASRAEEAVKVEFAESVFPPPSAGGYETTPRVLKTDFVVEWNRRPHEAEANAEALRATLMEALLDGRAHELIPFTGQSAGLVRKVKPAADIVQELMADAERILTDASRLTG